MGLFVKEGEGVGRIGIGKLEFNAAARVLVKGQVGPPNRADLTSEFEK